jgi:alkanesulfonate monooxygenase SsuD/methylene tetrahydromethanopterin reductase-like flavin-dependent oxidoreductase (luciferase family)
VRVGISLDLRNPPQWHSPWARHYSDTLEFIIEAERLGIDAVKVAEHHLFDDGHASQPLTILSAAAARTSRIRLSTGVAIAPLHPTMDLAEQAAIVDVISGGRLELALGVGYRIREYEAYGIDFKERYELFEDRVIGIRQIWAEGLSTPGPIQHPLPLWAGFHGRRGARLGGRLGMGLFSLPPDIWPDYLDGLAEGHHGIETARLGGTVDIMLVDDPDEALAKLGPRIEHNMNSYARYRAEGTGGRPLMFTASELLQAGPTSLHGFGAMTATSAVASIRELAMGRQIDVVYVVGAVSGVVDALAHRNLELIANEFKPQLASFDAETKLRGLP